MEKIETCRMTINISVGLLEQVDTYANKMCVNRTSAVCFLLSQALDSQKVMRDLGTLADLYQKEQEKRENEVKK